MKNKHIIYVIGVALLIVQIVLLVSKCQPDHCTQIAFKQKLKAGMVVGKSNLNAKSNSTGVPHDTWDNPMILTETLRDRPWFPYDSISNIIHACGKFDSIEQVWKAKTWVGFPQDITIRKDKRLLLSTVNCIVNGNILGEGTIELKGCASTLMVNGTIAPTIIQSIEEGCSIIINKPLGDNDGGLAEKIKVEVPCDWQLPITVPDENGVKWYYTEYK